MKKKFLLLLMCFIAITCAFMACGKNNVKQERIVDIPADKIIEVGTAFDWELAAVLDNGKTYLPASVTVTFGENETVETAENKFTATKAGIYTVTYTFAVGSENLTYTTRVTAVDTTAPSVLSSGELPMRAEKGATVTIPAFSAKDICDGDLEVNVSVYINDTDKTPIEVTEANTFVIPSYESVTVEATATDAAGNKAVDTTVISVRQEHELDFMNDEFYTMSRVVSGGGGGVEYNTNADYVIEGTGSLKMFSGAWGLYPSCTLPQIKETIEALGGKDAFTQKVKEVTYLVYNDAPYDCTLEFMGQKPKTEGEGKDNISLNATLAVAKAWTKVTVSAEEIAKVYDTTDDYYVYWNGAAFLTDNRYTEFVAYYDCFRMVMNDDPGPSLNIDVKDIEEQNDYGGEMQLKIAGKDLFNGLNKDNLIISARIAGKNEQIPVTEKEDGYYLSVVLGEYSVSYMYKNGEEIDVFTQNIRITEPLSDMNFDGFEQEYAGSRVIHTKGDPSVKRSNEFARTGDNALKITNNAWSSGGFVVLKLADEMLNAIDENSMVWLYVYINGGNQAITSYNLDFRVYDVDDDNYAGESATSGLVSNAATGVWYKVEFAGKQVIAVKAAGGITAYVPIQFTGGGGNLEFDYYIDDITLMQKDTAVTMTLEDKTVKYESGNKIELADFGDTTKFCGIDHAKLTVTCNGQPFAYVLEENKLMFEPSAAGRYEFVYTHTNGNKIATETQIITVYTPLDPAYYDGFEGTGNRYIGKVKGAVTAAESTEQYKSGNASLRLTYNSDGAVVMMLDTDMLKQITDTAVLTFYVYAAEQGGTVNQIFAAYNPTDSDYLGATRVSIEAGAGETWRKVTLTGDALQAVKENGGITLYASRTGIDTFICYIDDITVTDTDTTVMITCEDIATTMPADGASLELAEFTGIGFSEENLSVRMNGSPYTEYTLSDGKLSFTPSQAGTYTFVYTHTRGNKIVTKTQTVVLAAALSDPLKDDCASGGNAHVLNNGFTITASIVDTGDSTHPKAWKITNGEPSNPGVRPLLVLDSDMRKALQNATKLSFDVKVELDSSVAAGASVNLDFGAYKEGAGDNGLGSWGPRDQVTSSEWKTLSFEGDALAMLKESGTIWMWFNGSTCNYSYFITNITLTVPAQT